MSQKYLLKQSYLFGALLAITFAISACGSNTDTITKTEITRERPVAFVTATLAPATATLPPTATLEPTATTLPPTDTPVPPTETPVPEDTATSVPPPDTPTPPADTPTPAPPTNTPTPEPPAVDFSISEIRVLGLGENNGGIEGAGASHIIYINVIDAAGNPIDGAHIINTAPYPGETISGDKGPGKAELIMWQEVFNLAIDSVNGAPVTSEVSHNLSIVNPVATDIVGKLGGADYSNPTCVTLDDCPIPIPPGKSKHFSYQITFRRNY